jgi:hypothetical protein
MLSQHLQRLRWDLMSRWRLVLRLQLCRRVSNPARDGNRDGNTQWFHGRRAEEMDLRPKKMLVHVHGVRARVSETKRLQQHDVG